ncbi:MAG: glycosyltransferase [Verrucomicrobiota bacterium]
MLTVFILFFTWTLLAVSALGIFTVFIGYPVILFLRLATRKRLTEKLSGSSNDLEYFPSVSIITVSHKTGNLLERKITNLNELEYPRDSLEFIFVLDGTEDKLNEVELQEQLPGIRVKQFATGKRKGKAFGLNQAAVNSESDILVFSDVDSLLDEEGLQYLVNHFQNPEVGGVCGQRMIRNDETALSAPQSRYLAFDNLIKFLEARVGSLTSNEGKFYAIRRCLFQPVDPAATDDLYNCLTVVEAGYRFVFEPRALMYIAAPSRHGRHEIERRRRIVTRSLHGIAQHRKLLNPRFAGWYAVSLFINKILRRCLPFFLIGLLLSSFILAWQSRSILILFILQLAFYSSALVYPFSSKITMNSKLGKLFLKPFSLSAYFILGNYGTLRGVIDFLRGRRIVKWNPVKPDDD